MTLRNPSPKEPLAIKVPSVRFVREQDGKPELLLKSRLAGYFEQHPDVQRAYLARITAGDQSGVALCLKTIHGPDLTLVRAVGAVFSDFFVGDEHLDILFLTESQESAVAKVCPPFYVVTTRDN